jgi:hypothetical protein
MNDFPPDEDYGYGKIPLENNIKVWENLEFEIIKFIDILFAC